MHNAILNASTLETIQANLTKQVFGKFYMYYSSY